MNPFGVEEHEVSKADFSAAKQKYERRQKNADKVQDASAAIAGTGGAAIGLSGLRGAYYSDYPNKLKAHEAKIAATKPGLKRTVLRHAVKTKPGFPVYAAVAAGTATGFAAQHYKKASEKQALKYTPKKDRVAKASAKRMRQRANKTGPVQAATKNRSLKPLAVGGALVAGGAYAYTKKKKTTETPVEKKFGPDANPASIKQAKQRQGTLGTAAAATGLAAFGMKGGAKILPKLVKGGPKGAKYARHLDQAADTVLFGAAGLGGAAGLHNASIYRAEGKLPGQDASMPKQVKPQKKNVMKAYDPERARRRRSKVAEGALVAGAAGATGAGVKGTRKVVIPLKAKTVRSKGQLAAGAGMALAAGAVHAHRNGSGKPTGDWYSQAKPRPRIPAGPAQTVRYPTRPARSGSKEEWEHRLRASMRQNPN